MEKTQTEQTPTPVRKSHFWRNFFLFFSLIILLILSVPLAFLSTSSGQRTMLSFADRFLDELSIGEISGGLGENTGLVLKNVHFKQPSLELNIAQTALKITLSELFHGKLQVDEFNLLAPNIRLLASEAPKETQASKSSTATFALPLALEIKNLHLKDFQFQSENDFISLGDFHSALSFSMTQGVVLAPTQINNLLLNFPKRAPVKAKGKELATAPLAQNLAQSTAKNSLAPKKFSKPKVKQQGVDWVGIESFLSKPLLNLQDFSLPFPIIIKNLTGKNWQYIQGVNAHDKLLISQLNLQARAEKSTVYLQNLHLESPLGVISAQGDVKTQGDFPVNVKLTGDLSAISPNHYLYDLNWVHLFLPQKNHLDLVISGALKQATQLKLQTNGVINANLNGKVYLSMGKMPLELELKSPKLQYPFNRLAKNPYKFENVNLHIFGNLLAYNLKLDGDFVGKNIPKGPISLSATGDLSHIDVHDLYLSVLKSKAHFKGKLSWRNRLKWESNLDLNRFNFGDYLFENVPELKKFKGLPAVLSGYLSYQGYYDFYDDDWFMQVPEIHLNGQISQQDFALNTKQVVLRKKWLSVPELNLVYGKNKVNLTGEVSHNSQLNLTINAPDLRGLLPGLQANIQGHMQMQSEGSFVNTEVHLTGKNIRFQDFSLHNFSLNSQLSSQQQIQGDIKLELDKLNFQQFHFPHIKLVGKGNESQHQFDLSSQGNPLALNLQLQGNFARNSNVWRGVLQQTDLHSPVGNWQPNHAVDLVYNLNVNQGNIGAHCWQNRDATLCFPKMFHVGKTGNIPFDVTNLDLAMLNNLIKQRSFQGHFSGKGYMQWFENYPAKMNVQLTGSNIQLNQRLDYRHFYVNFPQISARVALVNNQLQSQANLDVRCPYRKNCAPLSHIDLKMAVQDLAKSRQLSGYLKIDSLSMALAKQLFAKDENIEGNLFADLNLAGSLTTPLLTGDLGLNQVKANLKLLPFDINEGHLNVQFKGQDMALNGKISTPKSALSLTGQASWDKLDEYQASVRLLADNFYLNLPLSPTVAEMNISPDILLTADNHSLKMEGNVKIPWARIHVKDLPDSGVSVSSDLVILDGPNKTKPNKMLQLAETGETPQGRKIFSNLKIDLGDDVNLKAYGLNTNLNGILSLTQQKGLLGLYGQVNLEHGSFVAYGQNLIIKKGYIGFSGLPTKPIINLNAIRNPTEMLDNDIVAGIRVSGYTTAPKVNVYTQPAMSEDQALSYLLTGHSLDSNEDTGTSGSVGAALLSLSLAQTGNAVGALGKVFGIQNLNLSTSGVGNKSQVAVSGNITDRLQVRYGVGLFTGLAELTLRFKLLPKLYLQSVSSVNQAVDLFYQFEI